MKKITQKQGKRFVDEFTKGIIALGAITVNSPLSNHLSFELETTVGKLEINIPVEQSYCYSVFSRFEDVDKAKTKFDCNSNSGKYNIHLSPEYNPIDKAIESALMHFEYTLS